MRDLFSVLTDTHGFIERVLFGAAPVAQTFFVDDDIKFRYRLEGIVTLVDALHFQTALSNSKEAQEQIAFGDVVLLNKIDLATSAHLDTLESMIKKMNATAKIYRTERSIVPLDAVMKIGGFDVRKLCACACVLFGMTPRSMQHQAYMERCAMPCRPLKWTPSFSNRSTRLSGWGSTMCRMYRRGKSLR